MERDVADILDRFSIIILKKENSPDVCSLEFNVYQEEIKRIKELHRNIEIDRLLMFLKNINARIWELESDVRKGSLDNNTDEVGRRAILIRKFNSLRVEFKNIINSLCNSGFEEVKIDHLSQRV